MSSNNNDKFITLANIYKPPKQNNNNSNIETFINEFAPFIQQLGNSRSNTIIAGDFNIDLLKMNDQPVFCDFLDTLVSNSYEPKITLPTRFSNNNCTLIDNIFYKGSFYKSVEGSGVLINHISDHLPCFTYLKMKNSTTCNHRYLYKCKINEHTIKQMYDQLVAQNSYDKLDKSMSSDPNLNYKTFAKWLTSAKQKYLPLKKIKFNKYKHKRNNWITSGILRSIKYNDNLYKELKQTEPNSAIFFKKKHDLKVYNSILNKCIRKAKTFYYHTQFTKYKTNIKRTWIEINSIIN